jgi:two-component system response regulator NreC
MPSAIGIIEDDRITSDLLAAVCAREFGALVVAREATGRAGLAAMRENRPELAILDISLPDIDGLDIARTLLAEQPGIRVLMLSALRDPLTLIRVRELGVHGFVDKREQSVAMLKGAIAAVLEGRTFYATIMTTVLTQLARDPHAFHRVLSDHEQRILMLIGNAYSDAEIAAAMAMRPATVQSRRRDIMSKLGIHSTPKLIQYASEMGFARLGRYQASQGAETV